MSDVFISYARSSGEAQAKRISDALRNLGYTVWRDDELPAHRPYTDVIEERLKAAKAVVVLWSAEAVKSQWVRAEADVAREAGTLVQLSLDGSVPPLPFNQIQCADMAGWSGDGKHPGWSKLAASVQDLVNGRAPAPATPRAVPNSAAEPLLAVLAFDNLSGDPETAYFSDGVSEEILQTVARGADLKVIGRTSSFSLRGSEKAASRVAAALNATHVLDGSVRRAGSKVRIAANLIECERQTTLWSDRYDRDLTDVFVLWDEIATSVAAALKSAFAKPPPAAPIDPAIYDLFLRSRGIDLKMLTEVVARAPSFARGWAMFAFRGAFMLRNQRDEALAAGLKREQVVEAAETALRLDPHMGLAYQALAFLEPWAAFREREAFYEKAIAASPNDASVLGRTASFRGIVGRSREGLSLARRAHELDPLEPLVMSQLAIQLNLAGRFEEALRLGEVGYARWPDHFSGGVLGAAARLGDAAKVQRLIDSWTPAEIALQKEVIWYARNRIKPDPASLKGWLEEQRSDLERTGTVPLHAPAWLHSFGLTEEAFELIDKASFAYMFDQEGSPPRAPQYPGGIFGRANAAMIQDPRFVRFCAKLGLCDYWIETGKWPDCADEVPYDFPAEARRLTSVPTH